MNVKRPDSGIIVALIAMIIMFALSAITSLGYMGPNPVGEPTSYGKPMVVPAGITFSIWSIIYLGLLVFPIYQLVIQKPRHVLWGKVRQLYSINVILNGLWLVCASYSFQLLTVLIIFVMLYTLVRINDLLNQIQFGGGEISYWFERIVFSLYFAWITIASALNICTALTYYNFSGFGISELVWSWIVLLVIAIIGSAIFRKYRDRAFGAVVVWAFAGLIIEHWGINPSLVYLSGGVIVFFLLSIIYMGRPLSQKPLSSIGNH